MDPNYRHLAERFFDRLRSLEPASVLDVGCGRGYLVGRCFEFELPATGVDTSRKRLALVRDVGFRCARSGAAPLPFAADAFDWVTIRHVLHHLPDIPFALAEACRVARRGLLLAEPWFDARIPTQAASERASNWIKRQDDHHGHPHRPALTAHDMVARLPADLAHSWEFDQYLRLWPLALERFHKYADKWRDKLPDDHPERSLYDEALADLTEHGQTDCGTVIVTVRFDG